MKKFSKKEIIVSVIITTYNRPSFLDRALRSVINQTYKNLEIIVIDDGSTVNNEEIIDKLNKNTLRIKYIKFKKNQGAPFARNYGAQLAEGKYLCFLDDDDEWLPEKIEKQVEKFKKSSDQNLGLIYTGGYIKNEKGEITEIIKPEIRGKILKFLLIRNFILASSVMIKKECFKKSKMFDPKFYSCQDWDLWIRISSKYEIDFVKDILTIIYKHSSHSIGTSEKAILGYLQLYKKFFITYLKNGLQKYLCIKFIELAKEFQKREKRIRTLECLFFACISDPKYFFRKIKNKIQKKR